MTTADQDENQNSKLKASETDLTPAKKLSDITHLAKSKSENPIGISRWYAQMNFMYIYNLNYSYRAKTESIFQGGTPCYFDFYFLNDQVFSQFHLFDNLWRETLLLSHFDNPKISKILQFGQLPQKAIYRQI